MKKTVTHIIANTLIALLLLVVTTDSQATETKASGHEAEETELQLEGWMTSEAVMYNSTFNVAIEAESTLELEDWMTSDMSWNFSFVEEADANLELESWMTYDDIMVEENTIIEPALTLEDWMINSNSFK